MVKGLNIKCRSCNKLFWIEIQLKFGARINEFAHDTLECFLHEATFYSECSYCQAPIKIAATFFSLKEPKLTQLIENPHYIG